MKKLFGVLRMCETSILQPKWLELERCNYPDRLSPYHRLDGYSVIVEPGKEDVFREWVDSHVSAAKAGDGAVGYADAIVPVLSMLTGQEFYAISEAMLAYYSDFDAMMHYCAYNPEAEKLDVFGGEVIPIAEEEEAEFLGVAPVPQPESALPDKIPTTGSKGGEKTEQAVPVPDLQSAIGTEVVLQSTSKVEDVSAPSTNVEAVPVEMFTEEQIRRIVAYLLTLDGEEVATVFLRSLCNIYYGEAKCGITALLLRMFGHLFAEQEG